MFQLRLSKKMIRDGFQVTLGAFLLAVSMNSILLPNHLVSGGVNGISIVLHSLVGWSPSFVLFAINIPLLFLCFLLLGKEVGFKTIYGSLIFPTFVALTTHFPTLTQTPLLATLFGGALTGLGLGLVFRGNASTGGTAILSQIAHKYLRVPIGVAMIFIDGAVIFTAFFAFSLDTILYSLLCLFLIGRVVDQIQVGLARSKNVWIISREAMAIKEILLTQLDKGATLIPVTGAYENTQHFLVMTVIPERDFILVKEVVLSLDEHAFIVTMPAAEVLGRGFSLSRIAETFGLEE